jgi:hypothetical protein
MMKQKPAPAGPLSILDPEAEDWLDAINRVASAPDVETTPPHPPYNAATAGRLKAQQRKHERRQKTERQREAAKRSQEHLDRMKAQHDKEEEERQQHEENFRPVRQAIIIGAVAAFEIYACKHGLSASALQRGTLDIIRRLHPFTHTD